MKPPDEITRELVKQWLAKAEADYGLAAHIVSENVPWHDAVGFHSQQAVEKFMKALLVRHQVEFSKTHDLGKLRDLIAAVDATLADTLKDTATLNPYGVAVRYPSDDPELTTEEAKAAFDLAAKARAAILAAFGSYLNEP